ncbi:MAG: prephenate dehydrogenase [Terriglobales bacterium]
MQRVMIIGTGLIGASAGLALRAAGFAGVVTGWDRNPSAATEALRRGAVDTIAEDALAEAAVTDVIVLATPVLAILEWMLRLAPLLGENQLLTDVGSTKQAICACAREQFNRTGRAAFLPGHPMAGKEISGAAAAEPDLFHGAVWLFTPLVQPESPLAAEWRRWVVNIGSRTLDLEPGRHDELCAWASHLPQMLATALSAALEEEFSASAAGLRAVGGRALRDMTRLGASPYSMWRDIAQTNAQPIANTLRRLEQHLAKLRAKLAKPGLQDEFDAANRFRSSF